jgi:hypothetical protein
VATTTKRMGAILGDTRPSTVLPKVERNPFAYVVSPMLAGGGAGGAVIIAATIASIAAAIAVPAFAKYRGASAAAAIQERAHAVEPLPEVAPAAPLAEPKAAAVEERREAPPAEKPPVARPAARKKSPKAKW